MKTGKELGWECRNGRDPVDCLFGNPEDPVKDPAPGVMVINETMDPVVKSGDGYVPVLAEVSDCTGTIQISAKNGQDEPWSKGTVQDQVVWEETVGVTAGFAPISWDGDVAIDPLSIGHGDHGSGVGRLERDDPAHSMTFRAGALRRVEIRDRSIKELLV